uniref:Uncharacterized protein n=1 Tax=Globisporangium ultimum (strain ATCC 200006 / CBS 805.95 / DAOM BR144) TaxID=431595 RepID=K3W6Y5_GLOUD
MEELYNPYSRDFTEAFPVNLHRHTEPAQWAEHCTFLTHALFSSIPVEDFFKSSKQSYSSQFLCARRWFQHSFVGLNELPAFEKPGMVNANRLRKMGELVIEVLRRRSVPYLLSFNENIDKVGMLAR